MISSDMTAPSTGQAVTRSALVGVVVSALGFFVDLYDIIIFSAERIDSGSQALPWVRISGLHFS